MNSFESDQPVSISEMVRNSEKMCLNPQCGDTVRLVLSKYYLQKNAVTIQNDSLSHKCLQLHSHSDYLVNISDILDMKYDNIKCFSSCLKQLQDFTSILLIIQSSLQNDQENSRFNLKDKNVYDLCIFQAQSISRYFQQMNQNYFLDSLRDIIMEYSDNTISYKQLSVSVSKLIEEYNIIEKSIYQPILLKMNKGVPIKEETNILDCIKIYTNSLIGMRMELLSKLICNHSNQLENITYLSLMSFSYLQVIVRIYKRFYFHYLQSVHSYSDKEQKTMKKLNDNLIKQLIKYAQYFQQFCDIQNSQVCYSDCLELNPQSTEAFVEIINLFKKYGNSNQQKMSHQLALLQFPQKALFFQGILEVFNITGSEQAIIIKEYQNSINGNEKQGEFILLSKLFSEKVKDLNTHKIFLEYHQTTQPTQYFNNLRQQLLNKNLNSKNLNPIKKLEDIVSSGLKVVQQQSKVSKILSAKDKNKIMSLNQEQNQQKVSSKVLKTQDINEIENVKQTQKQTQSVPLVKQIYNTTNNNQVTKSPSKKPIVILTPQEKNTVLKQMPVQEIQQKKEQSQKNCSDKKNIKKTKINCNKANYQQNDLIVISSSEDLEMISDESVSFIEVIKKKVKVTEKPSSSKGKQTSASKRDDFYPFNKEPCNKIKVSKPLQMKDTSTNYSTSSNTNLSGSPCNYYEILSSSESLQSSESLHSSSSLILIDPKYNSIEINY